MDFTGWIPAWPDFMNFHLFDVKQNIFAYSFSDSSYNYGHNSKSTKLKIPLSWISPVSINLALVQINKPEHFSVSAVIVSPLSEGYASTSMLICCDSVPCCTHLKTFLMTVRPCQHFANVPNVEEITVRNMHLCYDLRPQYGFQTTTVFECLINAILSD